MASTTNLKAAERVIRENITPNGVNAITAQLLQDVLLNITTAAEADIEEMLNSMESVLGRYVFDTDNLRDLSVTTNKIKDYAVTTNKIGTMAVTRDKLDTDVTDFLLTQDMKDYLIKQIGGDKQKEAQDKFTGSTGNAGISKYVYGEITAANAQKKVIVTLSFDGVRIIGNDAPCGWTLVGDRYERVISLNGGETEAPPTIFTYTPNSGIYKGYTVIYNSSEAAVEWTYPIYYGFVPYNSESMINTALVSQMTYATSDVINPSATIKNNTSSDGYLCILTRGSASATQLGISMLDCEKLAPNFTSPKNSAITMSGYKVYFSKNQVAAGSSLGNIDLKIYQE